MVELSRKIKMKKERQRKKGVVEFFRCIVAVSPCATAKMYK